MRLDHIIHDLFLLMLNLTQLKDQDRILKVFIEAVNTLWDGVHLRMLPEGETGNGETIKIATSRNSFGSFCIEGKLDDVPDDLLSLMRNSVRMLAIILENRMQTELLEDEKLQFEAAVRKRTAELLKSSKELEHEIGERKQAEEALQKAHDELEQRVNERTVELVKANKLLTKEIEVRKKAEEELRESEKRYRTLFNNIPVGIGVSTSDGRVLAANDAMLQMFGYQEAGLDQISLKELYLNPEDRDLFMKQFKTVGFFSGLETQFKRKDGTPFYGSITVTPFPMENLDAHLTVMVDVTQRKQVEEEREKLINELQEALKEIKTLRSMLPLCSFCKKIRDDQGYWEQVDVYIHKHLQADISHSICPDCAKEQYSDLDIHE